MKTAFFLLFFVFMVGAFANAEETYEEFRLEEGETVLEVVVRESKAKPDSEFVTVLHPRYDDVKYDVNDPAQMTRLHVGTRIRIDSRLLRPRLVAETVSPRIAMNLMPPVVASATTSSIIVANEVLDFEPATPRPWYQHNYPADEVAKFLLIVMGTTAAILWSVVIFVLRPPTLIRRYELSTPTVLTVSAPLQLHSSQPQLLLPPSSNSPTNT
jgi:hypothetical protein